MGGSGVAGKIFSEFYSEKPVCLADDYELPRFVSSKTLVVAISYSGNTEETIGLAKQAVKKQARVAVISSGGEISDYGDQQIKIPKRDLNPRSATGYMLMPLLNGFGLLGASDVSGSYGLLKGLDDDNKECMEDARSVADGNRIPVIYGASPFKSIAYRWKTQFNENAKVIAYSNSFPELNHNDTLALAQTYRKSDLCFFVFGSESSKVSKRISVTSRITSSEFRIITPKGRSDVEKMFYLMHYGDYVSYHLSLIRKVDPADTALIEELKKNMKEG